MKRLIRKPVHKGKRCPVTKRQFFLQVDILTLHVTLTDFGLARFMNQSSSIGTTTMLSGSPGFQSPEQLRAESIGLECDVYAYGAVIYVTVTETSLWPGLSHYQIMQKVTSNVKPDTTVLPSRYQSLCNQCFSAKRERPGIMKVLSQLQELIQI